MENEENVFENEGRNAFEETSYKRLNEYQPIDFLRALIDNYKDKDIDTHNE